MKSAAEDQLRAGIAIVSHEATRTGAPLIALGIGRELKARGFPVVTILLGPGELQPEFAKIGPVFMAPRKDGPSYHFESRAWARAIKRGIYLAESAFQENDERFWRRVAKYLGDKQIRYAVCNTVLSGHAATRLKHAGLALIGMVHEMPHTIRHYGLGEPTDALVRAVGAIVFPCSQVRDAFVGNFPLAGKPNFIFPQGINFVPHLFAAETRAASRSTFRAGLGISPDAVLVLGCGTAEFRKGIDLFAQAAREVKFLRAKRIVFAWAGKIYEPSFMTWVKKDVIEMGLEERLLFLGPQDDMAPCLAAADMFFLSSREDPFPTVVLEAMASGLPVVGFAGSGGIETQVSGGSGITVPYGDVTSAAKALLRLAGDPGERDRMGRLGREHVTGLGGYPEYVGKLIAALSTIAAPTASSDA